MNGWMLLANFLPCFVGVYGNNGIKKCGMTLLMQNVLFKSERHLCCLNGKKTQE